MHRLISILVSAVVGALIFGGGTFGYLMLTGPKGDPSVYGTALLTGTIMAVIGCVVGTLYRLLRR